MMRTKSRAIHRIQAWRPLLATVAGLGISPLHGDIIYVDAVEGTAGNTYATGGSLGDTSWIDTTTNAADVDNNSWMKRTGGSPGWTEHNRGDVIQGLVSGYPNTLGEITTEITGLADGTYDVWVFFWEQTASGTQNWVIDAGLASGALTAYSSLLGPVAGTDSGTAVDANTLTFSNSPSVTAAGGNQTMFGVKLGQVTVTGGSAIKVYVNKLTGSGGNNRTIFDGVGYELTSPAGPDSDGDGLLDGVESNTGVFVDATNTGTNPLDPDSDDDGTLDGVEVAQGTDPNDPESNLTDPVLAVDFNRDDAFGSPSQSLFRVVSGSAADQTANASTYAKTFGGKQLTISQPGDVKFEFRGANGDSARAIPGGDISLSYLVSDFIATRSGAIDLTITGLAAGNYLFRSYHLDTFTGSGLGFAQGTTTTPNTIQARMIGGAVKASVQPTALGPNGLNTTFINDSQIPTLSFGFTHDGAGPLTIELRATQSNGTDSFLLLNGFELFQASP